MAESIADAMRVSYVVVERATATGSEVAAGAVNRTERASDGCRRRSAGRSSAHWLSPTVAAGELSTRASPPARRPGVASRHRHPRRRPCGRPATVVRGPGRGAREEERRRLRRDLHDGLGSALAGIDLRLGYAGPPRPTPMREAQRGASRRALVLAEVRRLVQDLRPPALDELGLVGAIQQHAIRLSDERLTLELVGAAPATPLPAAGRGRRLPHRARRR